MIKRWLFFLVDNNPAERAPSTGNELRSLTAHHLDLPLGGVHLDAAWTKNRKPGFQPLPQATLDRMRAFGESEEPLRLYEGADRRGCSRTPIPSSPLLFVPSQPARSVKRDLKQAGIPEFIVGKGKLDFHAVRVAFINFLIESGLATPKEVQELARHSTLDLAMNVSGRTREDRLRAAVEQIGQLVRPIDDRVPSVSTPSAGSELKSATPFETRDCASKKTGSSDRTRTQFQPIPNLRRISPEVREVLAESSVTAHSPKRRIAVSRSSHAQ